MSIPPSSPSTQKSLFQLSLIDSLPIPIPLQNATITYSSIDGSMFEDSFEHAGGDAKTETVTTIQFLNAFLKERIIQKQTATKNLVTEAPDIGGNINLGGDPMNNDLAIGGGAEMNNAKFLSFIEKQKTSIV